MKKILIITFIFVMSFCMMGYSEIELAGRSGILYSEEEADWQLFSDGEGRLSYNALGHVQTLDYDNVKTDLQNYMGYQWAVGVRGTYKEELEGYIKIASYGPTEYDAPLAPRGPVHTIFGDVGEYWGKKLLPRLHEWWVDMPLWGTPLNVKFGLFQHVVASGLALGGFYQNYGVNLYYESADFEWTFRFTVPDIEQKWYLGPYLIAERETFNINYDSRAYFWESDLIMTIGDVVMQPYIGFLADMTPWARRSSVYGQRVDRDYLGTYGGKVEAQVGDFNFELEAARNFGEAISIDPQFPDTEHAGYFFVVGGSYSYEEKLIPRAKLYYISGNKFNGDDLTRGMLTPSVNREFSVFSPTNSNLADTHYPAFDAGPLVFTAMGSAFNAGIWRPDMFGDPYLMSNLIAPNVGIDIMPFDKLFISVDYWYLRSQEPPIGADTMMNTYTLPSSLGNEIDIFVEYYAHENITLSFWGGIFFPGEYYRQSRGDGDPIGVATAPRYDGGASNAWQAETAITFTY